MKITLNLKEFKAAEKKLKSLNNISDILKTPMDRSLLKLQNRMADYPPTRAGQIYVRTGTLGRRWTTARREMPRRTAKHLRGRIGNNTSYGPWVQAEGFQSRWHRGRWETDEDVIQQESKFIRDEFQKALDKRVK